MGKSLRRFAGAGSTSIAAVQMARGIGLDVTRVGAPTDWYSIPVNYLREMLTVMYMWVFG